MGRRKLTKIIGIAGGGLFAAFLLALLALSLPQSGWRALSVQTGSMEPTFKPGALVFVHKVPVSSLHKGDIITYKNAKGTESITHRVVGFQNANGQHLLIVKGDANKAADDPVTTTQVIGKEVKSVPWAGNIIDFMHKPIGIILLVYLPAILLIIYEIKLMVERLSQLEIDKRRRAAREAVQKVYGGHRPRPVDYRHINGRP